MTKSLTFLFISLFLFSSCIFKSAEDYLIEAEKLESKGLYQEAIFLLDKAIEKDNNYIGAYINRGADKSALKDYKGALIDYQKTIELDKNNTLAFFNIGNNYKRLGDFSKSIEYYTKAFNTKEGKFYIDFIPNENSIFEIGVFDVPGHEIAYERGIAFYELDSLQLSINDFEICLNNKYLVKESYYMIGANYIKSGQIKEACKEFNISAKMGDIDSQEMLNVYCK